MTNVVDLRKPEGAKAYLKAVEYAPGKIGITHIVRPNGVRVSIEEAPEAEIILFATLIANDLMGPPEGNA